MSRYTGIKAVVGEGGDKLGNIIDGSGNGRGAGGGGGRGRVCNRELR